MRILIPMFSVKASTLSCLGYGLGSLQDYLGLRRSLLILNGASFQLLNRPTHEASGSSISKLTAVRTL